MALDQATVNQMNQRLAAFKAQRDGTAAPESTTATAAPAPVSTATPDDGGIGASLSSYRAQRDSGTLPKPIPKEGGNGLIDFAKGVFEAPATIIARPFQAAADFGDYLGTKIEADKAPTTGVQAAILRQDAERQQKKQTDSSVGGLVAPTPKNAADVEKDVGRAVQTVALGTGAPIAGGALFGAGASLEQGNDLLSAQTAIDAALGAGGGKVLDWVGKPILTATGKVVGTITPKIIKDVAAGGADAIAKFAADNQLLGGVAAKPSALLAKGLQTVDDKIGAGATALKTGTKTVLKEQFPNLDPQAHYTSINERDIRQPTTVNNRSYAKATDIYNKAKDQGINLDKVATENGVFHHDIAEGGKYSTEDTVNHLRDTVYEAGGEKARPAIKIASYETPRVPTGDIHAALLDRVEKIPATTADAEEKQKLIAAINKRYGTGSASAKAHPDGYDLTDLHDNRIRAGKNGKYIPGVSDAPTVFKAKLSRIEENVFKDTFDHAAPKELKIGDFRKESQKILTLADYLEKLDGTKVPEGVTKKAVRIFGRGLGGALGSKVGGFPGFLVGSRGGDMLFSTFEEFPNPIKRKILNSLQQDDPAAFKAIVDYIGVKESERLLQHKLPAAGASSFKEDTSSPTLFSTPKGVTTPIKQEAFDIANVEKGKIKAPKTNRKLKSYLQKIQYAQQADGTYTPANELPTIKTGPKKKSPKRLNDIKL